MKIPTKLQRLIPLLVIPLGAVLVLGGTAVAAGLEPLAVNCDNSQLEPHTGFQVAPACSDTAFGEIADQAKDPTLLIVDAPEKIQPDKAFTLKVATRNLIRDRFLAAGQGGYYLESAQLNADGLTRGHFHVACRVLTGGDQQAPGDPEAVPAFFKAVEDGGGSANSDTVAVEVPANLFKKGQLVQCTAWAGDGSHRTPMMERANQTPAIDSIRLKVGGDRDRDRDRDDRDDRDRGGR